MPPGDDLDLLRRRLVNVIGHALRTPAATVRGQAEIIAATDDPDVRAAAVEPLRRAARRLEEMIDEVLVVEGVETRLPTGRQDSVELAALLRDVADDLDGDAQLELSGDLDVRVEAPRDALSWALRGVLDNHVRYGQGPVVVALAADDERVTCTVRTPRGGVGATDDDLRLAFEPFFRGERAVVASTARLGVGLTITRRLLDAVGGRATLDRDPDGGVRTVLELPRR